MTTFFFSFTGNANIYVSRLDENYMGLYGLFPETDRFSAVVCDCGSIVKPQGFKNHLARNHSSTNGGSRASSKIFLYLCKSKGFNLGVLQNWIHPIIQPTPAD